MKHLEMSVLLAFGLFACGKLGDNSNNAAEAANPCLQGKYRIFESLFFKDSYEITPLPSYEQIVAICREASDSEKPELKQACMVADQHMAKTPTIPEEPSVDHPVYDQIWREGTAIALASKLNCQNSASSLPSVN